MEKQIDLVGLKAFARKNLREFPTLYNLLMEDRDSIPVEEFIIKVKVWLQLIEKADNFSQ